MPPFGDLSLYDPTYHRLIMLGIEKASYPHYNIKGDDSLHTRFRHGRLLDVKVELEKNVRRIVL